MTERGKDSDELRQLVTDMILSAQAVSVGKGARPATAESIYFEAAGFDNKEWHRARREGHLSSDKFNELNRCCKSSDQTAFRRRYDQWSEKSRKRIDPNPPRSKLPQWRFKTPKARGWEDACASLIETKGYSIDQIDYNINELIQSAVGDVRSREGEWAASQNAFLLMQAAYARFSRGALNDKRVLLTAISASIDLSALTYNRQFLQRAELMLNDFRKTDNFARCLQIDCRAHIAEKISHYSVQYIQEATKLFSEHVQRTRDMISAKEIVPDFHVLHRARLGSFQNYAMMRVRTGATLSEIADHIKYYQDAIESINTTASNTAVRDGQIFELSGDIWHAFLFGELKLNRQNRSRSLKGGDPEGALAEVRLAMDRCGGIANVPKHNARKLIRIEIEALRCLGVKSTW